MTPEQNRGERFRDGIVRSLRHQTPAPMHIVIIAWLYVILMMALTSTSVLGGIALFAGAGLAPVLVLVWLLGRRARRASVAEQEVHDRDARDAEADQ